MPVDAEPSVSGNLVIEDGLVRIVPPGGLYDAHTRYTSHFATCPQAQQHRKA